jgi:hypothetical protein
MNKTGFSIRMSICVGHSPQTRSFLSSDFNRSRSVSELLPTQKTKLPLLTTVCLRKTRRYAFMVYVGCIV